jgi:hypothetical protein
LYKGFFFLFLLTGYAPREIGDHALVIVTTAYCVSGERLGGEVLLDEGHHRDHLAGVWGDLVVASGAEEWADVREVLLFDAEGNGLTATCGVRPITWGALELHCLSG